MLLNCINCPVLYCARFLIYVRSFVLLCWLDYCRICMIHGLSTPVNLRVWCIKLLKSQLMLVFFYRTYWVCLVCIGENYTDLWIFPASRQLCSFLQQCSILYTVLQIHQILHESVLICLSIFCHFVFLCRQIAIFQVEYKSDVQTLQIENIPVQTHHFTTNLLDLDFC